jgi:hypothetical protein
VSIDVWTDGTVTLPSITDPDVADTLTFTLTGLASCMTWVSSSHDSVDCTQCSDSEVDSYVLTFTATDDDTTTSGANVLSYTDTYTIVV